MRIIHRLDELRKARAALKGGKLALVPTMGALHDGHLALVREAKWHAARVVVSIFVNPRQFGVNEDLDAYPRQLERDCALLQTEGVDLIWAPTAEEMYREGYATNVAVAGVSEGLCGAARPGHFDGVATVVCKLFNQVEPDVALFGEKDWQQLAVIRRMARDLDLRRPHADMVFGVPTVREQDGLALSSRNAYLSAEDRARAAVLPAAIKKAVAEISGGKPVAEALKRLRAALLSGGFDAVDYAELRDAETLVELTERPTDHARLLVAARIGGTRLIDNMEAWSG
ncbi:MAG: pantoate--beta-alanine ligase [Novosphingobium sp.]|nr:pantoate--beta-alanine ligase [Novosphingobium sp.]